MRKIVFASAVILLLSLLTMLQVVEVAEANPVPYPPTPNTELPTLEIQTPESYSPLYANNTLELNFTVTQPNSWISYYMGFMPIVGRCYVYVYLDGYLKTGFPSTHDIVDDYNVTFRNLTSVQHTVIIDVYALTFSQIGDYQSNVTQTVSFIVNSSSQTIEFNEDPVVTIRGQYPSPTSTTSPNSTLTPSIMPTLSTSSTPTITPTIPNSSWLHQTALTAIVIAVVIMAIALVSLVYFKRHKSNTDLVKKP